MYENETFSSPLRQQVGVSERPPEWSPDAKKRYSWTLLSLVCYPQRILKILKTKFCFDQLEVGEKSDEKSSKMQHFTKEILLNPIVILLKILVFSSLFSSTSS